MGLLQDLQLDDVGELAPESWMGMSPSGFLGG